MSVLREDEAGLLTNIGEIENRQVQGDQGGAKIIYQKSQLYFSVNDFILTESEIQKYLPRDFKYAETKRKKNHVHTVPFQNMLDKFSIVFKGENSFF